MMKQDTIEGDAGHEDGFSRDAMLGIPWVVGSKVLQFGLYMVVTVLVVRWLGKERYGLLSLTRNMAESLVIIASLGFSAVLIRFIPELVVHRNRAGMLRILWRVLAVQLIACAVVWLGLGLATPVLSRMFEVEFGHLLWIAGGLVLVELLKNYANDVLTSMFRVRAVTLMSAAQTVLWLVFLLATLHRFRSVGTVLLTQIAATAITLVWGYSHLVRLFRKMRWRSPPVGIGKRRVLRVAVPTFLNGLGRMLMLKYTEVFFLGLYFSPAVVGFYDLAYSMPQLVITFVPNSLQNLFQSAFAECYTRRPGSLPGLVSAVFRALMLITIPIAVFGAYFAGDMVLIFFGEEMAPAAPMARLFSLFHLIPLISFPLSMAILAREKVMNVFPLFVLQVSVNLALDFLLIPRWGMVGALGAVVLTSAMTLPVRLWVVRRLIGGIYFPYGFMLRVCGLHAIAGGLAFGIFGGRGLVALMLGGVVYGLGILVGYRVFPVLTAHDAQEMRRLRLSGLDRGIEFVTGLGGRGGHATERGAGN